MYSFIDTTAASAGTSLPIEALQINGRYIEELIPGYRTLNVTGREALSAELNVYETGVRDGSLVKSKRYPSREIVVRYQLIAKSPVEFREKFNILAGILNIEDATLIFNDENDKFYIGTPTEMSEVEPGLNSVVGEFKIFCADPFKYSVVEHEKQAQEGTWVGSDGLTHSGKFFVVDYKGTHESFPRIVTKFYTENEATGALTGAGDCGYVAFFNEEEKILQFGDPDEIDGTPAEQSQRLTHWYFDTSGSWGTAKTYWNMNAAADLFYVEDTCGSMKMGTDANGDYYLTPSDYASGEDKFGPSMTRVLPEDATGEVGASDFLFEFDLAFAPGSGSDGLNQVGVFYALAENSSGKVVAGIRVAKYAPGTSSGKVEYFVNGKSKKSYSLAITHTNPYFGKSATSRRIFIKKLGKEVIFNVCGEKQNFVCSDNGFDTMKATKISFVFLRYKNYTPLSYNGIYYAKFIKYNCSTFAEIPNKFSSGDVLEANCKGGEVYLNGLLSPELGAIGNDWEMFYLKPGVNRIGIGHSDWLTAGTAPDFKLKYREVFI